MNELIKERNELAKQLFVACEPDRHNSMECMRLANVMECMRLANVMMTRIYGEGWDQKEIPAEETPVPVVAGTNCPATISIVDFKGAKWVRVQALGEDFVVAPEDLDDGADHFSFDSAQEKLKELGLATFNRMQGFLIAIYIEEINKALEEAGGKKFAKDIYISSELWHPVGSCADYTGSLSWYFNGDTGCFYYDSRYNGGFRCRPVLAYTA